MFVVGQALFETGMANKIGGLVTRFAKTEKTLIIAIMVIAGVMSGFLSNTGTAQNQLFHVRANRNSDAADRNPLFRLFWI